MAVFNPEVPVAVLEALSDLGYDPSKVISLQVNDDFGLNRGELVIRLDSAECQILIDAYQGKEKK